ncbi:response regulator transcription factor [Amycolatopsis sp. NPDC088138]|uniref:response regulator transcription factor n=1 Tax=Amycolatopsis sp. NPDC088138 TaxID=3363938 RepID=UPI00381B3778
MTARSIVLSADTLTIPRVGTILAGYGIQLGPVLEQTGALRCFAIDGEPRLPIPIGGLSDRDRAILRGFADGLGYREVAELIDLAENSTKTYCTRHLFRRLGARDRASAVAMAYRMGVLDQWEVAA